VIDWGYIVDALPALFRGLGTTIMVSLLAIVFSLLLGLAGSVLRLSGIPLAGRIVAGYVEFVRSTPFLVQVFFIFYGLPDLGLTLSIFWSGVTALTIWASVFHIESFRAGFTSVGTNMSDASASLGLKGWQHGLFVVVPIALRSALPSTLNTVVGTIKNSAYLQAIGLAELTYVAIGRVASDFRTVEMFASICVIYLVIVLGVSALGHVLEKRLDEPYRQR
jgi:polar amino acid transport system permease protein